MNSFLEKLTKLKTRKFFLPTLQEEIEYTRLDAIDAAINKSLPGFIAGKILSVMKSSMAGQKPQEEDINPTDGDVVDFVVKATELWKKHVVNPKLTDEQVLDVPSEDRIAWLSHAITEAQKTKSEGGGELSVDEITNFPDGGNGGGNSKRTANK